jgi:hypothetical protein
MSLPLQVAWGKGAPSKIEVNSSAGRLISPPKVRFHLRHASAIFLLEGRSAGLL